MTQINPKQQEKKMEKEEVRIGKPSIYNMGMYKIHKRRVKNSIKIAIYRVGGGSLYK